MRLGLTVVALFAFVGCDPGPPTARQQAPASDRQADVAHRGRLVMPFDLERTTHRFTRLSTGGLQEVVSKDGDPAQVDLIRGHLRQEAERFRRGDFASPAAIHGAYMPGLQTLSAGAAQIKIDYSEVPAGAQLIYRAENPQLVSALHSWFDAQLRDHGRHASGH